MTYRELQTILNHQLTPEQLDQDVSIAIVTTSGVEVFPTELVDPNDPHYEDNQDERDAVYLDEIDDSILDKGHPYMTVFVS